MLEDKGCNKSTTNMNWNVEIEEVIDPTPDDTYQIKIMHPLTCRPTLVNGVPKVVVVGSSYQFHYESKNTTTDTDQWDSKVLIGTPTTFSVTCILDGKKPPVHKETVDVAGGGCGGQRPGYIGSFRLGGRKKRFILFGSKVAGLKRV